MDSTKILVSGMIYFLLMFGLSFVWKTPAGYAFIGITCVLWIVFYLLNMFGMFEKK